MLEPVSVRHSFLGLSTIQSDYILFTHSSVKDDFSEPSLCAWHLPQFSQQPCDLGPSLTPDCGWDLIQVSSSASTTHLAHVWLSWDTQGWLPITPIP